MTEYSRQVLRARDRQQAKVDAAFQRVQRRITARKALKMLPLDRSTVENPYPPSRHRPFGSTSKDWRAQQATESASGVRKLRKVAGAIIGGLAAAALMAGAR